MEVDATLGLTERLARASLLIDIPVINNLPNFAINTNPQSILKEGQKKKMAPTAEELRQQKKEAAREVIDVLQEIALLLNTNLTRTQLSLSVSLIENGVNPEALATVIKELRKVGEKARLEHGEGRDSSE
ncbi:hypothetical protein MMC30_000608 [Trapelia coarctata]|nr:hypothetical protein [Trapelia coarctata]